MERGLPRWEQEDGTKEGGCNMELPFVIYNPFSEIEFSDDYCYNVGTGRKIILSISG